MAKICASHHHFFAAIFLGCLSIGQVSAQSELKLKVSNGNTAGLFSVEGDITYSAENKLVQLDIPMGGDDADNPLFCFDFSDATTSSVTVNGRSSDLESGARLLLDSLHLSDSVTLAFDVSAATLELQIPAASSEIACFLRPLEEGQLVGSFGLFGVKKSASDAGSPPPAEEVIFADRFQDPDERPNLAVSLGERSLNANGGVDYTITITNGDIPATNVAVQQSIPLGLDVVVRSCSISDATNCLSEAWQDEYQKDVLRYEGFALAAGAEMVIEVTASRNESWPTSETGLPVYLAAAGVGQGAIGHDVDEVKLSPTSQ